MFEKKTWKSECRDSYCIVSLDILFCIKCEMDIKGDDRILFKKVQVVGEHLSIAFS